MLAALLGLLLPLLLEIPVAWFGLFIYAAVAHLEKISSLTTVIFFLVMLGTMAIGYFAPILGTKKQKVSFPRDTGTIFGGRQGTTPLTKHNLYLQCSYIYSGTVIPVFMQCDIHLIEKANGIKKSYARPWLFELIWFGEK